MWAERCANVDAMTDVSTTLTINRPAAEVFEFLAEMSNNPRWQKGQVSCEWTSAPPINVGSTYDQQARFAGRTIESSFDVTEFEPGRLIRIVSTSGPMPIDVTRSVVPLTDDSCEVSAIVKGEPPGLMAKVSGLVDPIVKRSVSGDYVRLKQLLEAGDLPPNHHGDYKQFNALFGYVASLTMVLGRQHDADVVAAMADLGPGVHVLDIGCGPGNAVRTAARTGARATGVDPSGPMLHMAKVLTRLRPPTGAVEWIEAGAEDMPLDDDAIDVCWSLKAVHHWPQLEEGMAEVARVLKPGGIFIAFEKRSEPGATGVASHGWTRQQADLFAQMLREDHAFTDVDVREQKSNGAPVLTVSGHAPHDR